MQIDVIWDIETDPLGNVQHIAQHGLDQDDVEHAVTYAIYEGTSDSSGYPLLYGPRCDGREIVVIYEEIDDTHIYPITAYIRERH